MTGQGTVHLLGGGRDDGALSPLVTTFVRDAAGTIDVPPHIVVLLVLEEDGDESAARYRALLSGAGADVAIHAIREGERFDASPLDGAQGILVGGGLTPAYHAACTPIAGAIRARIRAGIPYLGFSAGAAIAAERAVIGGHRVAAVEVCDEDAGEGLAEVTVVDGLGLVPFAVDVHAAQWGTLARLTAAVDAGLVSHGYAVDENTALVCRGGAVQGVAGLGAAWHVTPGGVNSDSVIVRRDLAR